MPKGIYQHKKGYRHTIETKIKIGRANRISLKGHKQSDDRKKKQSEIVKQIWMTGKRDRVTPHMIGENNVNWKGGITKLAEQIRKCFKYRQWRSDVFQRDDYTCQDCGVRGGRLEAHHIERFSIILEKNSIKTILDADICQELWNINNGLTLCVRCHNKTKHEKV